MNELKMNGPEESPTLRRKVSFHLIFEFTVHNKGYPQHYPGLNMEKQLTCMC